MINYARFDVDKSGELDPDETVRVLKMMIDEQVTSSGSCPTEPSTRFPECI